MTPSSEMTAAVYTCHDDCKRLLTVDLSKIKFYDWPTEQEFFNSTHNYKIAVIEFDYTNPKNFVPLATKFLNCDLVLVFSLEASPEIINLIKKFDLPNFVFVINVVLNFKLTSAKLVSQVPWICSTANFYLDPLRHILEKKLKAFSYKPYMFDVMYGLPRKHRSFVKSHLPNNTNQFYQTPYFSHPNGQINQTYNFDQTDLWEDEIVLSTNNNYECTYYGQTMMISQVMPFKIYNKTAYSLVCETSADNSISLFSEKITKPIIAHRLFIVVSGQNYLKNLRNLGFQTFGNIIDESYDQIENPTQRWAMAVEQAILLSKQDQKQVLKKIIPTVLHNFDTLTHLYTNHLSQELELFLLDKGYHKN